MAGLPYGSVPPPPPSMLIPGARRSSRGATDEKPVCKFGRSCFRRNKEHFDAFSHPRLDEATSNEVSLPTRPSGPPRSPRASELSPPPSARKVILDTDRGDGEPDGSATPAASSSEAPSLAQALGMSAVRADAGKPMCRYGKDCYNRSTAHLEHYAHAGDEAPKEPRSSVAMRSHGRPKSPFAAAGRMVAAATRLVSPPRSNDIDPSQSAPLQGSVVLSNYVDEQLATDERAASEHTPRLPGDPSSAPEISRALSGASSASRPRSHSPKPTVPSFKVREWGSSSASPDRRRYSHGDKPTAPSIEVREWGSSSATRTTGASSSSSAPRGPSPYELPSDSVEAHYFDKPPTIEAPSLAQMLGMSAVRADAGKPMCRYGSSSAPDARSASSSMSPAADKLRPSGGGARRETPGGSDREKWGKPSIAAEVSGSGKGSGRGGAVGGGRGGAGKVAPEGADAAAPSGSSYKVNALKVSVAGLWGINAFLVGLAVIRIFIISQ